MAVHGSERDFREISYSIAEAAKKLDADEETVRGRALRGQLGAYFNNGVLWVAKSAVDWEHHLLRP